MRNTTLYNFYFERSNGERVLLLDNCTEREAMAEMQRFLDDHNYKSYYCRSWVTPDGEVYFDVGSHTEFFIMVSAYKEKERGETNV